MRSILIPLLVTAGLFGLAACGQSEASTDLPTESELQDIESAADAAAEQITPESADAEFERLKSEIGR